MIGTIKDVLQSMEDGIFNFCEDGKCIGCGQCCSSLLPVSEKEIRNIKKYVKKKWIQPHRHSAGLPVKNVPFDFTCPFLNNTKEKDKCDIYPVRPDICRYFKCDIPPKCCEQYEKRFLQNTQCF